MRNRTRSIEENAGNQRVWFRRLTARRASALSLAVLFGLGLNSVTARAYVEKRGSVREIRAAAYYPEACVNVGGTWWYLNVSNDDARSDFHKRMILSAYLSGRDLFVAAGNAQGDTSTVCDGLQAYPIQALQVK